jgi:hydrogenase maturation protein HypF
MPSACSIKVRGVVQGVGFRPFVFRLARANTLAGWVRNGEKGVEIFLEGADQNLNAFVRALAAEPPPAAQITKIEIESTEPVGCCEFTIQESSRGESPSVRISPDLPVCEDCLRELFDPSDRRYFYPYINCTNCGPRYTVIRALPYDRANTTMQPWSLDEFCAGQYHDPGNRRFHAQPVACPGCGPEYYLQAGERVSFAEMKRAFAAPRRCSARARLLRSRDWAVITSRATPQTLTPFWPCASESIARKNRLH